MKRISWYTVGKWRADYRRLNHVQRRRFWQRILNPNPRHRPRWMNIRLSYVTADISANDVLREMYPDVPHGSITYQHTPFLAMLAREAL